MDFPLLPCANRFCGCFCLGSGPVFVLWCFSAFCFAFSAGETQVWLGDLRVVAFCVVVVSLFCFNRFADFKDFASLYRVFAAYSHVRTEPLARHRPHSRKKNQRGPSRGIVGRHSLRRKITTPCHCHGSGIEWSALPEWSLRRRRYGGHCGISLLQSGPSSHGE